MIFLKEFYSVIIFVLAQVFVCVLAMKMPNYFFNLDFGDLALQTTFFDKNIITWFVGAKIIAFFSWLLVMIQVSVMFKNKHVALTYALLIYAIIGLVIELDVLITRLVIFDQLAHFSTEQLVPSFKMVGVSFFMLASWWIGISILSFKHPNFNQNISLHQIGIGLVNLLFSGYICFSYIFNLTFNSVIAKYFILISTVLYVMWGLLHIKIMKAN